jgi:hypothetical protein
LLRRACLTFLLAISCAPAVELHIQFGALERILGEQLFTEEGRRYVKGNRTTRCNFAYLESPRVESDNGRLRIRARFTGRSAWNVLGQCVGLGDDFRVVITARPAYSDGQLRLQDVTVASDGKTGIYIRRVCAAMSSSLARDFRYPLEAEARKLLEDGSKRELRGFKAPEIRVSADALVLVIDFELRVK